MVQCYQFLKLSHCNPEPQLWNAHLLAFLISVTVCCFTLVAITVVCYYR